MLGSLRGIAAASLDTRTLIEVGGVGYWVFTGAWHPSGETMAYLYHAVREDASDLYGFDSLTGLRLFEQLISVSSVGPKAALAILSLSTPDNIAGAIARQDTAFLTAASGIGNKAAQKIVLELHQKMGGFAPTETAQPQQELRLALESLGYKPLEINAALLELPNDLQSLAEQITWSLQHLSR